MNTTKLNRENLIECREKLGITKQEAARRLHMSQPAYLRYESGERCPSVHVIQAMADVFNTSLAYLIGQTDNPKPDSFIIKSDTDPVLFRLIEKYKDTDETTKNRLLAYLSEFDKVHN